MFRCIIPSSLGDLTLASDGAALTGLWLPGQKYFAAGLNPDAEDAPQLPVFMETCAWLNAYFAGQPLPTMPKLAPHGTAFRQAVWQQLLEIPFGETVTYGQIAARLNEQSVSASPRAVGGAVGRNPISILIPCHRVVGTSGSLTGYAGGLAAKTYLLQLEKEHIER